MAVGDLGGGGLVGGARDRAMKGRWGRAARWGVLLGRTLQWLGPPVVLLALHSWWQGVPGWAAILAGTLVAGLVAQAGLALARFRYRSLGQAARDLALLVLLAAAGWAGTRLALGAGGGSVDPSLLALAAVYLVNVWPAA